MISAGHQWLPIIVIVVLLVHSPIENALNRGVYELRWHEMMATSGEGIQQGLKKFGINYNFSINNFLMLL
jgi:hypothetical protein